MEESGRSDTKRKKELGKGGKRRKEKKNEATGLARRKEVEERRKTVIR